MEWIRNVRRPIQEIGLDGRIVAPRPELLGIDGRGNFSIAQPQFLIVQSLDRRWNGSTRPFVRFFFRAIDRDRNNVMPDRKPIAVTKPMRCAHPMVGTVQEGAVGGYVVQPVTSVLVANFAMLAGNVAGRIGQGPIEMCSAPDVDAALATNATTDWPTIRQGGLVDQLKNKFHGVFQ